MNESTEPYMVILECTNCLSRAYESFPRGIRWAIAAASDRRECSYCGCFDWVIAEQQMGDLNNE